MILSFFSVKIIPAAYAAHDCKLYISHLPISIWNEKRRKKAEQDLFSRSAIGVSFPYFTTFFNGIQRINAYTLPIREVTSCVTEKVVWNTAIFASIGAGRRFGIRISEITIPMNSAFTTDPAAMPGNQSAVSFAFFRDQSHTQDQKGIARHDTRHDRRNGTDDRASRNKE